jgi:hypothetical protein
MAKICGKGWQKDLHVLTCLVPFGQSVDCERVPQVMKPRLTKPRIAAVNSCRGAQAAKVGIYNRVPEALVLP